MTSDLGPCLEESVPSEVGEAREAANGEELGVARASEPHRATVRGEGLSLIGEEEHVLIEEPEVVVPDNREEDTGNEGLNVSRSEGPDEGV
ncbi:hypothetical protein AMTR_s00037p00217830 [Amborella trichopoda]|uniref:Uncharacterized protein n=1 Tax=Amborella trichopoda TaxID=13333 RepID=U5DAI2_AMBTC|nr:hypothetical protein AMTR_s00037p00217830 [Amborella trichopoda]